MIRDLSSIVGNTIETDVCIVGSGPAMTSFIQNYLFLPGKKPRISVFESSAVAEQVFSHSPGSAYSSDVQHFYKDTTKGWIGSNFPMYSVTSRLRALGGTGHVWSGWCWPMEKVNLEPRPSYRANSWGIPFYDIEKYFLKANEFLRLGEYQYEEPDYYINKFKNYNLELMDTSGTLFKTRILKINRLNFFNEYRNKIVSCKDVDIYLNANCTSIRTEGEKVISLIMASKKDKSFKLYNVKASVFILMCGAIENCKILMNSDIHCKLPAIGANFYEHPYMWYAGKIQLDNINHNIRNYYFVNSAIEIEKQYGILPVLVADDLQLKDSKFGNFRILLGGQPNIPGTINLSWETKPVNSGYLELSDDKNELGQKSLIINSSLAAEDKASARNIILSLQEFLQSNYNTSIEDLPDFDEDPVNWRGSHLIVPGNHPMGTTIMGTDPTSSVVDNDLKLHNYKNIYACSTGVFPSGGYENPTMTLCALSIRLSELISNKYS